MSSDARSRPRTVIVSTSDVPMDVGNSIVVISRSLSWWERSRGAATASGPVLADPRRHTSQLTGVDGERTTWSSSTEHDHPEPVSYQRSIPRRLPVRPPVPGPSDNPPSPGRRPARRKPDARYDRSVTEPPDRGATES